jgi:PAS domain S-box-containing protein
MKSAFKDAQAASLFNGWDELGAKSSSWKIEREQPAAEMGAPFFPDQNGGVYEQLLASFPVMMHAMDGSGRLSAVNRQWCATLGYHPSEVIGRSFNELLTAQSRSHLITQIYPKYLQAGNCRNEEMFVHRKDGSLATVLLSMNAYRGDKGRIERSICLLHDITERKIAEIASSRADYRYRGGFINAPYGMALVSPTGQVETCNPALAALLGRKENEVVTMALDELLDKSDRSKIVNGLRLLMGGEGKPLDLDVSLVAADGRRIHCQARIAPMKNDKGEVELLVVQLSDIADRKVAVQRSQQSQKMEAIGQLTGGLAHDFNNLLTIILGNLQLVEEKMQGDGLVTRRLRESIDAASKGSELTRQLLAVAKPTQHEPRPVSVTSVVEGMEALITRALGDEVQVSFECERGLPDVVLDPSQLESALLNLAINARDAMPRGGKLAFEVRLAAASTGDKDLPAGPCIEVCVADTGEGMPPDVLEKVFQPFFTTKEQGKGSGLGLAMVQGFARQFGGRVAIRSEVGAGTAVSIMLPCQAVGNVDSGHAGAVAAPSLEMPAWMEQAIAEGDGSLETATPAARRRKILVVEDQEAVRAVACGFLSDFGYDVVEAEDGFQALSRLQEDQDIDLMFSDIVMPGGMNGFDLAQAAAGMRPDIKVVHTSGYPKGAMVHQDEPRFRQGFIIMKPYRREELQKIITDAFANQ